MLDQSRKLSEIMKEMAESLFHDSDAPSPEAVQVALFFALIAWNESVGLDNARVGNRTFLEPIEEENPALWSEFKSRDIDGLVDELVEHKKSYYPDDQRRILTCGMMNEKVRVEWLPPVAPGVDSNWEMRLHGLVRTGRRIEAIKFLKDTRHVSIAEATKQVKKIASYLGLR